MGTCRFILAGTLAMTVMGAGYTGKPVGAEPQDGVEITQGPSVESSLTRVDPCDPRNLVSRGNNCFAIELYQRLRGGEGNLFFSPYSICTALSMVYAGANGRTQGEMAKVLCLPTSRDALRKLESSQEPIAREQFNRTIGEIIRDINLRASQGGCELCVANALWNQSGYKLLRDFVSLIEKERTGHLQKVDFANATGARRTINTRVEERTKGRIKDLIGPGMLNESTRLVLTNVIYFKGDWAKRFHKGLTFEGEFTLLNRTKVHVPMMNQRSEFGFADMEGLQILEMPYIGYCRNTGSVVPSI